MKRRSGKTKRRSGKTKRSGKLLQGGISELVPSATFKFFTLGQRSPSSKAFFWGERGRARVLGIDNGPPRRKAEVANARKRMRKNGRTNGTNDGNGKQVRHVLRLVHATRLPGRDRDEADEIRPSRQSSKMETRGSSTRREGKTAEESVMPRIFSFPLGLLGLLGLFGLLGLLGLLSRREQKYRFGSILVAIAEWFMSLPTL